MAKNSYYIEIGKKLVKEFGLHPSQARKILEIEVTSGFSGGFAGFLQKLTGIQTPLEIGMNYLKDKEKLRGNSAYEYLYQELTEMSALRESIRFSFK